MMWFDGFAISFFVCIYFQSLVFVSLADELELFVNVFGGYFGTKFNYYSLYIIINVFKGLRFFFSLSQINFSLPTQSLRTINTVFRRSYFSLFVLCNSIGVHLGFSLSQIDKFTLRHYSTYIRLISHFHRVYAFN